MLQHHRCTITLKTKHKPRLSVPYSIIYNATTNAYVATVSALTLRATAPTLAQTKTAIKQAITQLLEPHTSTN